MGVCVAATITVEKVEETKPEAVEILKTAETRARQFGHGGKRTVFFCVFLTINHSKILKIYWHFVPGFGYYPYLSFGGISSILIFQKHIDSSHHTLSFINK